VDFSAIARRFRGEVKLYAKPQRTRNSPRLYVDYPKRHIEG
jgi:hypothetical protein